MKLDLAHANTSDATAFKTRCSSGGATPGAGETASSRNDKELRSQFEALVQSGGPEGTASLGPAGNGQTMSTRSVPNQGDSRGHAGRSSVSGSDTSGDSDTTGPLGRTAGSAATLSEARRSKQQAIIQEKLKKLSAVPLSKEEAAVSKSFIHPDHVRAIGLAAKSGKFAVSFRPAGEATLGRLADGAPAKGHDITEKTVKQGSVKDAEGGQDAVRLKAMQDAGIEGYVGHWDNHRLVGLHMDPATEKFASSAEPEKRDLASALRRAPEGGLYYPVNENDLKGSLASLKAVKDWRSLPFTGDYDTHDLISFQGHRSPAVSGSGEETRIIGRLNTALAAADPQRPVEKTNHVMVQHGSQHNYVAHMMDGEKGKPIAAPVARAQFPVAMCDRGDWSMIHSRQELDYFYHERGMTLKSTWKDNGGVALQEAGPGSVRLYHSPSSSDSESSG